jgi:hypothetical protein
VVRILKVAENDIAIKYQEFSKIETKNKRAKGCTKVVQPS